MNERVSLARISGNQIPYQLAGVGVKGGYVYGESDERAKFPIEKPVKPEDLAATIFQLVGIDPQTEIYGRNNRPLVIGGDCLYDVIA